MYAGGRAVMPEVRLNHLWRQGMSMFSKQAAIKSAIAVTLMVATFLLLEGLSRIIHTVREDVSAIQPEWFTYSSELGWQKRPLFKGYVFGELQRGNPVRYMREFDQSGFLSVDTLQVATHHHKRILAIGDSNTFGWGVPTQDSFVEVLDDMLPDTDIVNMGVSGYTSFQGYETLARHLESLQPDLVIASFNFNDRRAVPSEEVMDSRGKFGREAILHQTDLLRSNLYLYRTMQYGMSMLGMVNGASNSGPAMDVRQAHVRVPPAKYRHNLKSIARLCNEHNVPLIFIVLQDNPLHTEHLRNGVSALAEGRYEIAEHHLRIAANLDNWFSDLARKYLADILEQRRTKEEAQEAAAITLPAWSHTHGGRPLHLDSEYNDIMRIVAREEGAILVEAGLLLAREPSMYLDLCHPDERGHRVIATLLRPAVEALLQGPYVTARS
jgi:lysophospholipase L1-like esterase